MPIYRGAGGAGDATADGSSEALLIRELAIEVQADADAASDSATAAASSASGAATSATNASNSASAAATSATNASNSASAASTSATNAANSATAAQTAETAAELAETNAETAETNAETAATNAASSASAASTSATNASNSASAASTSATNASNSASAASTSASNASTSATAAAGSASSASTSASNAATSETNAAASASSASTSATTATTQAGIATTKAGEAATSATNAATSATTATTQAGIATTQATNASNSASAAATSATNASNSASSASTSATNAANSATAAAASAASINLSSIAITGGSINGTTIGATTPSTGKFTTLEATGVTTVQAGTVSAPAITTTGDTNTGIFFPAADTIAFTEGGVEAMRIDSAGNLGLGVTPSAWGGNRAVMQIANTGMSLFSYTTAGSSNQYAFLTNNSFQNNSNDNIYVRSNPAAMYVQYNNEHQFFNAASGTAGNTITFTERMRIDSSGNVGIGTSSPAQKLHISVASGSVYQQISSGANDIYFGYVSADSAASIQSNGAITFLSGGSYTERMRITSAGNVGIGTSSPNTKLEVRGNELRIYDTGTSNVNLSLRNSTTGDAAGFGLQQDGVNTILYNGSNGYMSFYTNATERMRINSSGNVGIGTSSVSYDLDVSKTIAAGSVITSITNSSSTGAARLYLGSDAGAGAAAFQVFSSSHSTRPSIVTIGSGTSIPLVFDTNGTERMRIDSSGNVQIGTTAANGYNFRVAGSIPAQFVSNSTAVSNSYGAVAVYRQAKANNDGVGAAFQLNNSSDAQTEYGYIGAFITSNTTGAGGLLFCTDTARTERMRIDSSGNLLVGTTSAVAGQTDAGLHVSATRGVAIQGTGSSGDQAILVWHTATSGNNIFQEFLTEGSLTFRGSIDYNRAAGLVRYNVTSDATLKNIIGDSNGQRSLEILNTTRIREFAWKSDEAQKTQIGVIAQELYETYKGAVSVGGADNDGNYKPWGVDKTAFTFHLIAGWQAHEKIIQEQQALIENLTTRLNALEEK
jgi:hypothetical protein